MIKQQLVKVLNFSLRRRIPSKFTEEPIEPTFLLPLVRYDQGLGGMMKSLTKKMMNTEDEEEVAQNKSESNKKEEDIKEKGGRQMIPEPTTK